MPDDKKIGFFDVIKSTLMSFFGVQKESVRQRDFEHGRPLHFIVTGIVLTLLFIAILVGIVKIVLRLAGV